MPNVLSLSDFPGLKILSLKCLFLKSLVFRELAGFAGRTSKKLKRGDKGTKREENRGKQRKTEENRGRQRKTEEKEEERKGSSF